MVTREELERMAMHYDTAMAHAFRRALGIKPYWRARRKHAPHTGSASRAGATIVHVDKYAGIGECFANRRHINF